MTKPPINLEVAAVAEALRPLEARLAAVEKRLEGAITVHVAQQMIDAAVGGIQDRVREIHDNLKSVDLHLRQAEQAAQTVQIVNERLEHTGKLLDRLEKQVKKGEDHDRVVEDKVDTLAAQVNQHRVALWGDATLRDGPKSLYGMVEELLSRVGEMGTLRAILEAQTGMLNEHAAFINRRQAIEQSVIQVMRKLALTRAIWIRLALALLGAGGLGALLAELFRALGG